MATPRPPSPIALSKAPSTFIFIHPSSGGFHFSEALSFLSRPLTSVTDRVLSFGVKHWSLMPDAAQLALILDQESY